MLKRRTPRLQRGRGFTLVELMVALVVGLIVVGAVLALVASIMNSNRQTLQSTRLNQELRATMAVIANDLRRSRGVEDPMTVATANAGKPNNPFATVDTSTAGCIRYGYYDLIDDDGDGDVTNDNYHSIYLSGTKIVRSTASTFAGATCTLAGRTLGSDQVAIDALTVTPNSSSSSVRQYVVQLRGHLVDQDTQLSAVTRTITENVFIRSVGQ